MARIAAISAADRLSPSHRALARPMPCSADTDPACAATSRYTASSAESSSGSGPSTFTCRFPTPI